MEYDTLRANDMDTDGGTNGGGLRLEMITPARIFPKAPKILVHGQSYAKLDSFVMEGDFMILGKGDRIQNPFVSKKHCLIRRIDDEYSIVDLSKNWTFHNGVKMIKGVSEELKNGDTLWLMGVQFYVHGIGK